MLMAAPGMMMMITYTASIGLALTYTAELLRLLHRRCKEVLEVFAPEAICLEDEGEKYLTTLRRWRTVHGHFGDSSSLDCPTLGPSLIS